jgi:hypothetical protein
LKSSQTELAHANRELLRNLIRTETILGSAVTLSMALLTGAGGLGTAASGLGVATATAAIQIKLNRREVVEDSPVGFLFEMQTRHR